jgi:hypothetical protein
VNSLFPFTFQRSLNELKSTSLLNHQDLHTNIQQRRSNADLWIKPNIRKFLIWTKSDLLDNSKVEETLQTWMREVEKLLTESVAGLFIEIQELEILCSLRVQIMSLLVGTDEEPGPFEERVSKIFIGEIAAQMTRLMMSRVKLVHQLEQLAKDSISNFKGIHNWRCSDCSG